MTKLMAKGRQTKLSKTIHGKNKQSTQNQLPNSWENEDKPNQEQQSIEKKTNKEHTKQMTQLMAK